MHNSINIKLNEDKYFDSMINFLQVGIIYYEILKYNLKFLIKSSIIIIYYQQVFLSDKMYNL